jgi:inosine-uridine nucleoside N-ribohydrolase
MGAWGRGRSEGAAGRCGVFPAMLVLACLSCGETGGGEPAAGGAHHQDGGIPSPALIIVDTDTAISVPTGLDVDDDLAVLFALASTEVGVLGLTVTYGNAPISETYPDAVRLAALAGLAEMPVLRGAGWLQRDLDEPTAASRFMIDTILSLPAGTVTMVCIGPVSNLAAALTQEPAIEERIRRVVLMGGNARSGLVDLNFSAHPAATQMVLASRIPKVVVPAETCIQTTFRRQELDAIRASPDAVACEFLPRLEAFVALWTVLGPILYAGYPERADNGFFPWDVVAMAYEATPWLFSDERCMSMHMEGAVLVTAPCEGESGDHRYRVTVPGRLDGAAFRRIALERICAVGRAQGGEPPVLLQCPFLGETQSGHAAFSSSGMSTPPGVYPVK